MVSRHGASLGYVHFYFGGRNSSTIYSSESRPAKQHGTRWQPCHAHDPSPSRWTGPKISGRSNGSMCNTISPFWKMRTLPDD